MSGSLSYNSDIKEVINGKIYLPLLLTGVFFAFLALILLLGTVGESYLLSFAVLLSVPLIFLTIRYPKFWIITIALSNIIFFNDRGDEITAIETIVILDYIVTLMVWFLWKLVTKDKIIDNIADLAVIFYAVFIIANLIIAMLNDIDIISWTREAFNLLLILFYFPIKKYFTEKKDIVILLIVYAIVVTTTAFVHFYTYATGLSSDIQYAYELSMGIRINQTLFTSAAMFGFIFALYQKSRIKSLIMLAFTVIAIGGLITSFSRTFWVFLVIGLLVTVFYLTPKLRMKFLLYSLLVSFFLVFSAFYIFQDKAKVVLTLIEKRFTSTSKGTQDVSVQSRFDEYSAVFKNIQSYPLAGTGLASDFIFYNFLIQKTVRTTIIHNGYLFVMMKLGIPMAIVFFFPYFFFIIKGERYARKSDDEFFKLLSLGAFLTIMLMIVSNFTASQIIQRESVFTTVLAFALVSIVINHFEKKDKLLNADN